MAEDEQRALEARKKSSEEAGGFDGDGTFDASDLARLRPLMRRVARQMPADKRGEFMELLAQTELISEYAAHGDEIEAAGHAVEAHRAEFEELAKDDTALIERARRLFSEEAFAPLRFHAADIQRAFSKVGYPSRTASNDAAIQTLRKAILFLATEHVRRSLAMRLLLLLPGYVTAGRLLDGWMIQDCAYWTVESPKESNPFLFEMFSLGLNEWEQQRESEKVGLLGEMGVNLDQLRSMKLDDVDNFLAALTADPQKLKQLESFLKAHPEMRSPMEAECWNLERDSTRLLERDDAEELLLSDEEVEPWIPVFEERLKAESPEFSQLVPGRKPDKALMKVFEKVVVSLASDMAQKIFIPARIEQLESQLRAYRSRLYASGEKLAANQAQGALISLRPQADPVDNFFLISLCYASIRAFMGAGAEPSSQSDEESDRVPTC
jgi:hypothetical protein